MNDSICLKFNKNIVEIRYKVMTRHKGMTSGPITAKVSQQAQSSLSPPVESIGVALPVLFVVESISV